MRKPCFITISFMIFGASLLAQQASMINVSIFTFKYADGHQTIFLEKSPGEFKSVTLSSANVIGPFKAVLGKEGAVFLHEKETSADGTETYPVIGEIKIPSEVKNPLLILAPRSGEPSYGALVIDSSLVKFPSGSYKLINFSRSDIRALIGKTPVTAPPLKVTSFDPSSDSDDVLNVHFQYKIAESWRTFGRTSWVNEPDKRSLLVAYLDSKTQRMKIKGIPLRSTRTVNKQN